MAKKKLEIAKFPAFYIFFVIPKGLEPLTSWAVTRCSIQLSYGTVTLGNTFTQMRCKDRNNGRMLKSFQQKYRQKKYLARLGYKFGYNLKNYLELSSI